MSLDLDFDLLLEKLEFVAAGGISLVRTDPNLVQYVVALTHFFKHVTQVEKTFKYINTYAFVFCVSV